MRRWWFTGLTYAAAQVHCTSNPHALYLETCHGRRQLLSALLLIGRNVQLISISGVMLGSRNKIWSPLVKKPLSFHCALNALEIASSQSKVRCNCLQRNLIHCSYCSITFSDYEA